MSSARIPTIRFLALSLVVFSVCPNAMATERIMPVGAHFEETRTAMEHVDMPLPECCLVHDATSHPAHVRVSVMPKNDDVYSGAAIGIVQGSRWEQVTAFAFPQKIFYQSAPFGERSTVRRE